MCNYGGSPTVTNCTFTANTAEHGGGLYNFGGSSPTVTNCIFWGDLPVEIYTDDATPTITYCNIEGGHSGEGNMNADPLFVSGPAGCFYLSQTSAGQVADSPCIDAGSGTAANMGLDTLFTGNGQGADPGIVDMGYHYAGPGERFANDHHECD
jgi:hypothetical protein